MSVCYDSNITLSAVPGCWQINEQGTCGRNQSTWILDTWVRSTSLSLHLSLPLCQLEPACPPAKDCLSPKTDVYYQVINPAMFRLAKQTLTGP